MRLRRAMLVPLVCAPLVWVGCVTAPAAPELAATPAPPAASERLGMEARGAPSAPAPLAPPTTPTVESLLSRMSVEAKIGQLMMVGFAGKSVDPAITDLVRGYRVGGVCLFGRNVDSSAQIGRLNDEVRALLADWVPPFIAVDQEGGNVVRVTDGNVVLPGNMVLGAARSPKLAYEAGLAQGEDLRRLGFNMNLAPVLDVNSNPRNPVIGVRAFSDDVSLVSTLGEQFVRGQQASGIVTIAKHFPGHGAVEVDSHRALPVVRAPLRDVRKALRPFEAAMRAGLDGLMTAHIATPALTGDETPATLSRRVLGGVLRDELKFEGLVITDELEMDAIDRHYGVGRAAVLAVAAGADMVLVPWRLEKKEEVYLALLDAARSGELPARVIDRAVRRVLATKIARGLFEPVAPLADRLAALGEKRELASRIARAGVTVLRAESDLLPLLAGRRVVVISPEASMIAALRRRLPALEALQVPAFPTPGERATLKGRARTLAARADVVVVGVSSSRQVELVTNAALGGAPVVAVVFGYPSLASQLHEAKVIIATYSAQPAATEAAAAVLAGELGAPGRLPVSLPRLPFGHGIELVPSENELSPPRTSARLRTLR